jgi:hypothetical protein
MNSKVGEQRSDSIPFTSFLVIIMKLTTLVLLSALFSPIALIPSAQANSLARPTCKLTRDCVYGPQVSDRWVEGARFEAKGDFDSAVVSYTKAFDASEKLSFPGQTQDQLKRLRACSAMGSLARLQGAMAGAEYMDTHQMTAESTKAAIEISRSKFGDTIASQISEFPELETSCP